MAGTKISISEDFGQLTGLLLNIAELDKNTEYTRIGYCTKVDIGTTQESKPFFKFNILDKGGHAIQARLFNVEDVERKGIVANNLKNQVVKIRFSLTNFSGVNSLTLYSIDPIPESALSREEFIGELPNIIDDVQFVKDIANGVCAKYPIIGSLITKYNLLSGIETVTMPDMWAERRGGAVKFTAKLLRVIDGCFEGNDLTSVRAIVILSELFMYWKYAANYEENVLSLGDNVNAILSKSDKYLDAVMSKAESTDNIVEFNICKETKHLLKCYFGYVEPETYASISVTALRSALITKLCMQDEHESMLPNTYKTIAMPNGEYKRIVRLEGR